MRTCFESMSGSGRIGNLSDFCPGDEDNSLAGGFVRKI